MNISLNTCLSREYTRQERVQSAMGRYNIFIVTFALTKDDDVEYSLILFLIFILFYFLKKRN